MKFMAPMVSQMLPGGHGRWSTKALSISTSSACDRRDLQFTWFFLHKINITGVLDASVFALILHVFG
jgi:hypothetical protein